MAAMASLDILTFAEQFLSKLTPLPVQYEASYNVPPIRQSADTSNSSLKPTVNIVKVTLKRLYEEPKVSIIKLSKTEPTLIKLYREAASLLECDISQVVLVQGGKVLNNDNDVSKVVSMTATNLPVYIFDRSTLKRMPELGSDFRKDFIDLLKKYGQNQPAFLADRFLENYVDWLVLNKPN